VLVEGLAAVTLARVVVALAPRVRRIGLTACAISLTQCVLGVILATSSGSPTHLFELINRLDGLKMLVLATAIAVATLAPRESGLPARLAYVGVPAVVALVASGIGYIARDGALAGAAAASLPLLLLWALSAGLTVGDVALPSGLDGVERSRALHGLADLTGDALEVHGATRALELEQQREAARVAEAEVVESDHDLVRGQ
jgi:hypothetical protein